MHNQIKTILDKEQQRQNTTIELIASENFASQAVMDLCGSVFTNKYAEGYSGKRYYNGCKHMDEIEDLAIDAVTSLYECEFANENISIKLSQTIKLKGVSWLTGSATGCDYSNQMLYVLTYKRIYAFEKTEKGYRFVKKKNLGRLQQWEGICVEQNQKRCSGR